jgi:hypothetical protein
MVDGSTARTLGRAFVALVALTVPACGGGASPEVASTSSLTTVVAPTTGVSDSTTTSTALGAGQPRYVIGFEQYKGPSSTSGSTTRPKSIVRYDRVTGETVVLVEAVRLVEGVSSVTIVDADLSPDGSSVAFTARWQDRKRQRDRHYDKIYLSGLFEVAADGSSGPRARLEADDPSRQTYSAVAYSPDGRRLAFTSGGRFGVVSIETGAVTWTEEAWGDRLAWAPDGSEMAVAQGESMGCSSVGVVQFSARSGTFSPPGSQAAGAGPWWDEGGMLHTTVPENTNTRSGCRRPVYVARDTDATYRWVLGETGTCWYTGAEPGVRGDEAATCTPLSLPEYLIAMSW